MYIYPWYCRWTWSPLTLKCLRIELASRTTHPASIYLKLQTCECWWRLSFQSDSLYGESSQRLAPMRIGADSDLGVAFVRVEKTGANFPCRWFLSLALKILSANNVGDGLATVIYAFFFSISCRWHLLLLMLLMPQDAPEFPISCSTYAP